MSDGEALLRAIVRAPEDDLPRLVYADWLDEAGHADRAALIRVQIELSRTRETEVLSVEDRQLAPVGDRPCQRRREWALPPAVRDRWPIDVGGWEWHRGFPEVWHCPLELWEGHGGEMVSIVPVRRVFLIDREPRVSSTNPRNRNWTWFKDDEGWVQRPDEKCLLPPGLFELLEPDALDMQLFEHARVYRSRAAALVALSDACLTWPSVAGSTTRHPTARL
jgi:uncharacterized protein (TIGR02996 family)